MESSTLLIMTFPEIVESKDLLWGRTCAVDNVRARRKGVLGKLYEIQISPERGLRNSLKFSQLFWHGICSALDYGQEIAGIIYIYIWYVCMHTHIYIYMTNSIDIRHDACICDIYIYIHYIYIHPYMIFFFDDMIWYMSCIHNMLIDNIYIYTHTHTRHTHIYCHFPVARDWPCSTPNMGPGSMVFFCCNCWIAVTRACHGQQWNSFLPDMTVWYIHIYILSFQSGFAGKW